jgi:hypothetical protein
MGNTRSYLLAVHRSRATRGIPSGSGDGKALIFRIGGDILTARIGAAIDFWEGGDGSPFSSIRRSDSDFKDLRLNRDWRVPQGLKYRIAT